MKLTQDKISQFEIEYKDYGTEIALKNFIVSFTTDLLIDIGVKDIKLTYKED